MAYGQYLQNPAMAGFGQQQPNFLTPPTFGGPPQTPLQGQMPAPQAASPQMQAAPQGAPQAPGAVSANDVQAMLALQNMQPQQQAIDRQRKMADMMRAGGAKQMQGTTVGQQYAAPGALQFIGDLAAQFGARAQEKAADENATRLGQQQTDAATRWFNRLTGKDTPDEMGPPTSAMNPQTARGALLKMFGMGG